MINVDGSEILDILIMLWETLDTVIVTIGDFEFTLMDFEVAMLFCNLVLDFMLPFWFADLENRALKQHKVGAYEWD